MVAHGKMVTMSFVTLQTQVDEWITMQTPGYFTPLQMVARLAEELGELSRAISHEFGEKRPKPGESKGDVADELCDLLFVAICLANSQKIDLDDAWKGLIRKLYERDATRWKETP
jgi:NTP pyrophosphatase (non-canonical NTP hydrolase)